MSFLNKYPYTDFHELNLDWFLEEFKKVTDKVADLDTTVQQFTEFVTNYFDNLDVQALVNAKLDEMVLNGTLSSLLAPLVADMEADVENTLNTQNNRISGLEGRMDTFASLPPGSTAGNAELLDIRVSKGGTVYASAGNAVRQSEAIVDNMCLNLFSIATSYKGYFTSTAVNPGFTPGFEDGVNWGFFVIPVKKGMQITISGLNSVGSGAYSAWLNSADPNDFAFQGQASNNNNGTFICKTDWYAITLYEPSLFIDSGCVKFDFVKNAMSVSSKEIDTGNYSYLLPDMNNLVGNEVFKMSIAAGVTTIPANMPWSAVPYYTPFLIVSVGNTSNPSNILAQQFVIGRGMEVWYRYKSSSWTAWEHYDGRGLYITVGSSGCDYTALIPALAKAITVPNSKVVVKDGTYDFITEMTTYVSANFFSNYSSSQTYGKGFTLTNGVELEMTGDSKIVCHYTGGRDDVRCTFSPFVSTQGDFTLRNVTIEASNVRYCVHDDPLVKGAGPYTHKYIDCAFTLDNRGQQGIANDTSQCIGGGLDIDSTIEIHDCYFCMYGTPAHNPVTSPQMGAVSYHNAPQPGAKGRIIITGCYCEYGTLAFGCWGPTTDVTPILVSNNSVCYAPRKYWEDPGNYPNDNYKLMAWNNEVR